MPPKFSVSRLMKAMEKLNFIKSATNCEMGSVLGTSLHFVGLSEVVTSIPKNPLVNIRALWGWLKATPNNMQPWESLHKERFCTKTLCMSHVWVKL